MSPQLTLAAIEQYISDQIEESHRLEYKSAGSLIRTDKARLEITKDVSAIANADGGIIIYGVNEHPEHRHLPEKIDPIDRSQISKEWLEHNINNIQPPIQGVEVYPIPISDNDPNLAIYVVEIPQSNTAHQATDCKYYYRFNFEVKCMTDTQVRDVMGRSKHPKIELSFHFRTSRAGPIATHDLIITVHNRGRIYAHYVNCAINLPTSLVIFKPELFDRNLTTIEGKQYHIIQHANTHRDTIEQWVGGGGDEPQKYRSLGPTWFKPILPGMNHQWIHDLPLNFKYSNLPSEDSLHWQIYADNAPPTNGTILIKDIPLVIETETTKSVIVKKFKRLQARIIMVIVTIIVMLLCSMFLLVVLPKLMPSFIG